MFICPPFNKVAAMPEDAIANLIFCWSYFRKVAPESLVAIGNKHMDVGLEQKRFDLIPATSRKIKGDSIKRMEILVPHPEFHLAPTFGVPAPVSSVLEGTGSTIVRHYPAKLLQFLKSDFRFLSPPRKTQKAHFAHCKNFKPDTAVHAYYGRPAIFDKKLPEHLKSDFRFSFSAPKHTQD
ncbi:hypothetical protein TNCV_1889471 [Trichonephila clavipes]|nr:hypothetical protein TNCV_1889471 [Trichonephila clavipes]